MRWTLKQGRAAGPPVNVGWHPTRPPGLPTGSIRENQPGAVRMAGVVDMSPETTSVRGSCETPVTHTMWSVTGCRSARVLTFAD